MAHLLTTPVHVRETLVYKYSIFYRLLQQRHCNGYEYLLLFLVYLPRLFASLRDYLLSKGFLHLMPGKIFLIYCHCDQYQWCWHPWYYSVVLPHLANYLFQQILFPFSFIPEGDTWCLYAIPPSVILILGWQSAS